jgi:hypothetical protein
MFKWISNWMGQRNFNSAWKKATEQKYQSGEISKEEYDDCVRAYNDKAVMKQARDQLKADDGMLGGISDWDWDAIYQWFVDYFIPAMRVIIPIVIMLLGPNPTEDE